MIVDLLVLIIVLVVAALVVAPLESLHWWSTRGAEEVLVLPGADGRRAAAGVLGVPGEVALRDEVPAPDGVVAGGDVLSPSAVPDAERREGGHRYVVYLSGIGALAGNDVPEEEFPLLEQLRQRLPGHVVIDDVFPYAVDNRGLTAERFFGRLWRWLQGVRVKNPNALLASLINMRNLMQLFVCADRRYGPTYNVGTAGEIARSLVRHGHRPGDADEVVLVGWSGGGQIALGAVWYLQALGLRTSVVSLGGMLSDDIALARVEHLWHLYGTKDFLQASGKVLFAGRWPVAHGSPWNTALAEGRISLLELGPYNHNIKQHYFDDTSTLPDGRTYLGKVIDTIGDLLEPAV